MLRVSRSEERVRSQLWEILTVLVLGFLRVVLAGVGVCARAARWRRSIISRQAKRITAERPHERLSVRVGGIGRLAAVINETFAPGVLV